MSARAGDERGAALILALVFITLVGVAAMVLASLGFSSQKAAVVYVDEGKVANALDAGVQAAIENARVAANPGVPEPFDCPGPSVPPAADPPLQVNGRSVRVACAGPAAPPPDPQTRAQLTFTASTVDRPCPAPQDATLVATAVFSTIGGTATGPRIARTTAWRLVPPQPCTP